MYNCVYRQDNHKQSFDSKFLLCVKSKEKQEDCRQVISCDELGNIRKYFGQQCKVIGNFSSKQQQGKVTSLAYSASHDSLFLGMSDGKIYVQKISSQKQCQFQGKPHISSINSIFLSNDGRILVTSSNDKISKVFNVSQQNGKITLNFLLSLKSHSRFLLKAKVSQDGQFLFSLDEKCFKMTRIMKNRTVSDQAKNSVQIYEQLEEMVCIVPSQSQSFLDFYLVDEQSVLIVHQNGLFDLIDLNTRRKLRSFGLGEQTEVQKCIFNQKIQKVFCVIKNAQSGKKSLVVFNLQLGSELNLIEMDLVDSFRDFDCYQNSDTFVIGLKSSLLFYEQQQKQTQEEIVVKKVTINKTQQIQTQSFKQEPAQILVDSLNQIQSQLQNISQRFVNMEKKVQQNENQTQFLIEKLENKKEEKENIPEINESNVVKNETLSEKLLNFKVQNGIFEQIDISNLQPQQEIPIENVTSFPPLNLNEIQSFIKEREKSLLESEINFSKMEQKDVFDEVLGQSLHKPSNIEMEQQANYSLISSLNINPSQYLTLAEKYQLDSKAFDYTQQQILLI